VLAKPQPGNTLPGWAEGEVATQDMGAQFATQVLLSHLDTTNDQSPLRILDACAAPGGKLAHLYEALFDSGRTATLTGIDISATRVEQTQGILQRLGHPLRISVADARQLDWWDGTLYSHILLDAPCSGTGTIRRHPDIKILLQAGAIPEHAKLQLQLLNNLWQTLASGGTLLYCTCSLLRAENDDVVGRFLEHQNKDANVQTITLPSGAATKYGWQLLPIDPHTDGFYFALLQKSSHKSDPSDQHEMTDANT
jgi:16S rRNA (cytosine967-C5)-methyltransferase